MAIVEGQASSGLPAYDVVTNVTTNPDDIVLTTPVTNVTQVTGSVNFSTDNGGSTIRDSETTGPVCYTRVTWQYNPIEWGAHGDGKSDDTAPLQNWLNSVQPHLGTVGTFVTTSPLVCPQNASIQGPSNSSQNNQPFTIEAAGSPGSTLQFSGTLPASTGAATQGLIGALSNCRISGVNLVGNGYFLPTTGTISNHSNCITSLGTTNGLQIGNYVAGANISGQTTVTSIGTCSGTSSVAVSGPELTCNPCNPENITFYGPDVVDIVGGSVAIEGFTSLSNGGNNLVCAATGNHIFDFQVKNTEISGAMNDNVQVQRSCADVRFIGDNIEMAGAGTGTGPFGGTVSQICGPGSSTCTGRGIVYSRTEATIADGVVQESQGIGIDLDSTESISISGMHIAGNGRGAYGGDGIRIAAAHNISICGNHIDANGGDYSDAVSAQILFDVSLLPSPTNPAASDDNINICGNVYEPRAQTFDVALRPSYVYDANPSVVLTNTHLYDAPRPQAASAVYSPTALALLPQLQVPQVPANAISGLILSNLTAAKINVSAGEASDSTNAVTMQLPLGCNVDLAQAANGPGGLDAGSVAATTTYFYFLIATSSGGNPACMASTSAVPSFTAQNSAPYTTTITGAATQSGLPYIYNLPSLAGLAPGQPVAGTDLSAGTTLAAGGTLTSQVIGQMSNPPQSNYTVVNLSSGTTANMGVAMALSDAFNFSSCGGQNQNALSAGGYTILQVVSTTQFNITPQVTNLPSGNDCVVVSSGYTLGLSSPPLDNNPNAAFTAYNGVYRMIGALYTDASKNAVKFTQDGDTFYLASPVVDVQTGPNSICASTVTGNPQTCPLSVPCGRNAATCPAGAGHNGLKVEAFGRVVGGSNGGDILLSSFDQTTIPAPTLFPGPPGFSTNSSSTQTSFPFLLYTDGFGNVRVQGSTGSTGNTVYEDTDGWVFHREGGPVVLQQNAAARAAPPAKPARKNRKRGHRTRTPKVRAMIQSNAGTSG